MESVTQNGKADNENPLLSSSNEQEDNSMKQSSTNVVPEAGDSTPACNEDVSSNPTLMDASKKDEDAASPSSSSNVCDLNGECSFMNMESPDMSCLDVHSEKEGSLERMMSECSSVAQHIKETINKVLLSREQPVDQDSGIQSAELMLQENIQERIADLEKVIQTSTSLTMFDDAVMASKDEGVGSEKPGDKETVLLEDISPVSGVAEQEGQSVAATTAKTEVENDESTSKNELLSAEQDVVDEELISQDLDSSQVDSAKESGEEKKSPKKAATAKADNAASRRKNDKSLEHLMKSLASFGTAEEKLDQLYKKHVKVLEEFKAYEAKCKQSERQVQQLLREKEQLQSDHNRTVLAKSRLESLCRELQRQNKAVKEESLLRIREEEEKRKEVASKFQATLNDISTLMQENHQRNANLREENTELAQKLKALMDHYEKWEKHMEKVVRQKELEAQLAKAKYAKVTLQQRQEREQFLLEKKQLLESVSELQKRCTDLTGNEVQLRTELGLYTSKYEEFQSVLNKSNEVFSTFKDDMTNMSKKIKKLEKETGQWKTRWENSNRALLEMAADKQQRDRELIAAHQKILTLEKLCRALQGERIELQNKLKQVLPDDGSLTAGKTSEKATEQKTAEVIEQQQG